MSISPEARQAAEEWGKGKYHTVYERECFAEGYDTATAKLKEELEATRDVVIRLVKLAHQQPSSSSYGAQTDQLYSHDKADAPVSKPSTTTDKLPNDMKRNFRQRSEGGVWVNDCEPSATTPEGTASSTKANTHRDEVSENEGSNPSRSTQDVEKIAQHWQIVDYGDSVGMVLQEGDDELAVLDTKLGYAKAARLRDRHNEALPQARAPLVEALEAWGDFPHPIKPHCDDCARAAIRAMELSFAALTGTEVK